MRNSLANIKTLVLFLTFAFAGHVLAAPETWFSGTANGEALDAVLATWDTNDVGEVSVAESVLSIDLPTNKVVKLTPSSYDSKSDMKTYVVVDDAVFTPTAYVDIDNTVVDGAQTALTVAYDDTPATNYYAYIGGTWKKLAGATPGEEAVDVTIELDYSKPAETNASFKVGSITLCDAEDSTKEVFPISGAQRCLSRIELAGCGKIHSITTSVEAAVNVTITPTSVTYGADFTNVTIVAEVSGEGYDQATYTLDWNGSAVQATVTRDGTTLTITAPIDAPSAGREAATYDIKVNGSTSGTQNTTVADNRNWIIEDSTHTGPTGTGTWEPGIVYDEGIPAVATVSDNTYTASNCSTGDLVTITFENLVYTEFSDLSVETPTGTQGAFALAETNINDQVSTNFCVLVMENENYTWKAATCTGVEANTNIAYTVVMTFDYVAKKYSVVVSDGTTTNNLTVSDQTQFDLCVTKAAVTDFVFKGSGTMSGIKGVDSTGYMAKDTLGNWFATIQAAILSGGKEFIILRPTGPAPDGWTFKTEDGITKLIKKVAKGLFFMAF